MDIKIEMPKMDRHNTYSTDILELDGSPTMARSVAYVVFALPVVFTVIFSTMVLVGALETMDRELNMWPGSAHSAHPIDNGMEVHGLQQMYSESDAIEFWVSVSDIQYDCGALNIQVHDGAGTLVEDHYYESQCFAENSLPLPLEELSFVVGERGTYTLTITMSVDDEHLSTSAVFTVE